MIDYTAEAINQIDALRLHFVDKGRIEAAIALENALELAERNIEMRPEAGLPAPRPYPDLARSAQLWTKAGRYWVAYRIGPPPVIIGVFYDSANLPGRV